MADTPFVSVVMPAYNAATTLGAAIRSILWQSYTNFELLVMDDGSTDATLDVAGGFADPRIRVVSDGVNRGVSAQLNRGIDLARGELLARMDDDDVSYPGRLELQVAHLVHHPQTDLIGARVLTFKGDGLPLGLLPFRQTHEQICGRPWTTFMLPGATFVGRTDWFRKYRYRVPRVAEDQDLLLRAYPESRFHCLPQVLYGYRQRGFRLRRTLTARWHLARVHMREHARRGRFGSMLLAPSYLLLKSGVDFAARLPGCEWLFFARLAAPASRVQLDEWRQVWDALRQDNS